MEWNEQEENYLKKLHFETHQMYKYFNKKNIEYQFIHKKYNLPIIIISALNSLIAIIMPSFLEQEYVSIINSIFSASTGILSSVLLYFKINDKISLFNSISVNMRHLSLKIAKELSIKKELRSQSGIDFLNECFNSYLSIIENSLPIEKNLKYYLNIEELKNLNIDDKDDFSSLSTTPKNNLNVDSKFELIELTEEEKKDDLP